MSRFKKILLGLFILFIIIQFIRPAKNVAAGPFMNDISHSVAVPDSISVILKRSCYDCHSNNTDYPLYAQVQPVGWWLSNHIEEGKRELNFNEFAAYSLKRKQNKLKEIVHETAEGDMPLSSYTFIHRYAKLTDEEKKKIAVWANEAIAALAKSGK